MNLFAQQSTEFIRRHIGPNKEETKQMLKTIGASSLEELIKKTVPSGIRMERPLKLAPSMNEKDYLDLIKEISLKNKVCKNYIGQGYYDTIIPSVILRNVFENPGWYTQYTPYQAEISQGRLESLLNFQTTVSDLTGLPLANASLLDEATAAAEAMNMCVERGGSGAAKRRVFWAQAETHPQTLAVMATRAEPLGIT